MMNEYGHCLPEEVRVDTEVRKYTHLTEDGEVMCQFTRKKTKEDRERVTDVLNGEPVVLTPAYYNGEWVDTTIAAKKAERDLKEVEQAMKLLAKVQKEREEEFIKTIGEFDADGGENE